MEQWNPRDSSLYAYLMRWSANSMATQGRSVGESEQDMPCILQIRIILDSICNRIKTGASLRTRRRRNQRPGSHTRTRTMIRVSSAGITTPKTLRIALLLAALCAAATAAAADPGGKQSIEQRQIQALQQQL